MAAATARRIHWGVERGLAETFAGRIPERYDEVIRALGEGSRESLSAVTPSPSPRLSSFTGEGLFTSSACLPLAHEVGEGGARCEAPGG